MVGGGGGGETPCIHELVVRVRQLASVARLERCTGVAGSIPARNLVAFFAPVPG